MGALDPGPVLVGRRLGGREVDQRAISSSCRVPHGLAVVEVHGRSTRSPSRSVGWSSHRPSLGVGSVCQASSSGTELEPAPGTVSAGGARRRRGPARCPRDGRPRPAPPPRPACAPTCRASRARRAGRARRGDASGRRSTAMRATSSAAVGETSTVPPVSVWVTRWSRGLPGARQLARVGGPSRPRRGAAPAHLDAALRRRARAPRPARRSTRSPRSTGVRSRRRVPAFEPERASRPPHHVGHTVGLGSDAGRVAAVGGGIAVLERLGHGAAAGCGARRSCDTHATARVDPPPPGGRAHARRPWPRPHELLDPLRDEPARRRRRSASEVAVTTRTTDWSCSLMNIARAVPTMPTPTLRMTTSGATIAAATSERAAGGAHDRPPRADDDRGEGGERHGLAGIAARPRPSGSRRPTRSATAPAAPGPSPPSRAPLARAPVAVESSPYCPRQTGSMGSAPGTRCLHSP